MKKIKSLEKIALNESIKSEKALTSALQKCGVFLMPPKGGHAEAGKNKHILCVPCKDRKSSQHALIMD